MDASNRGLTTFGLTVTGGTVTLGIKRKVKSRCYFRLAVICEETVTFGILQQMDIITWDETIPERGVYSLWEHSLKS